MTDAAARKQEFLVDSLPEKRRKFVLAYLGEAAGNATKAATIAGYRTPHPEGCQLLRNPTVLEAIEEMQLALGTDTESLISSAWEIRRYWTQVVRGEIADVVVRRDKDGDEHAEEVAVPVARRNEAARDLAKSLGLMMDKHQVDLRVTTAPKDVGEARSLLERHVAALGGTVTWEAQLESGDDDGE